MKKIIINADDFGLSEKFNQGILELAQKKIISSTTVMIEREFADPSGLLPLKNISIGLHLDLSSKSDFQKMECQIEKFQKLFGRLPSHLDGHKHRHLLPDNFPLAIKIATKYNLPLRSRYLQDRRTIIKNGLKTPQKYIDWHPVNAHELPGKLSSNDKKITELVCHPGYYDKNCDYPYNKEREEELGFLTGRTFKNSVRKFKLINYEEI